MDKLLTLMQNKPSAECVKNKFGSWLEALIAAGILENGTKIILKIY